ncbi:MAG: terminase large subunit [Sphingopyxis sp.]
MAGGLPSWLKPWKGVPEYRWAIDAWHRSAAQPGAWFDHAKADKVAELWPTVFRLTNDRFAGVPFKLLPWQDITVRLLFGWKHPIELIDPMTGAPTVQHVRIYQTLRLWIPRKNGKSEFLAALALMFWVFDGVPGGEGYVFARDDKQADLPFGKMKAMVAQSPAMSADVQSHATSMWLKPLASSFIRLTGAEDGKHGKSPTVTLGDEMHEWRSRKIEDDLRQGQGARTEPIALFGSSAGLKSNPVGVELFEESQQLLDGTLDDPSVLVVIFAAPEDAVWDDEEVWRRANPSLGLSPTLQYLRGEARKAKGSPAKEARFRCYHLGQFIDEHAAWLNAAKWKACGRGEPGWRGMAEANAGRRAFGAWDLSAVRDITAKVLLFPPDDEFTWWRLACRFWIPEAALEQRKSESKLPWDDWVASGAVELTPGDIVDQDFVKAAVIDDLGRFDLEAVGYDPWASLKLVTDIEKDCPALHERLFEVRQGIQSLGNATKEFERLVYAGRMDHGGHPVLNWMARNTMIRFDENLNYMPAKKRSKDKIDGIVAAVIALAVWLNGQGPVAVNPWDDPDFKLLET